MQLGVGERRTGLDTSGVWISPLHVFLSYFLFIKLIIIIGVVGRGHGERALALLLYVVENGEGMGGEVHEGRGSWLGLGHRAGTGHADYDTIAKSEEANAFTS
ncbi:hypothetical protein IMZ48_31320 [Candidatus Bathyarchaeota archaeon]|nr:hypothetical protein [Candidatus Bathyarchaeota archaeon]